MIDCGIVDDYKPVMRVLELFYLDGWILFIEFLYIQSQLLRNCFCKDFNRYAFFLFVSNSRTESSI